MELSVDGERVMLAVQSHAFSPTRMQAACESGECVAEAAAVSTAEPERWMHQQFVLARAADVVVQAQPAPSVYTC